MRVILGKKREERILSMNEIVHQISEWLIEEVNEGLNEGYE
jgi:23S rRNA maturation-related 3'-5' exoribonuclease YhaM